jgi:hypothetical protein
VRSACLPTWFCDRKNQREWDSRFIGLLKRDYLNLDAVISTILKDERLSLVCAMNIRSYVDKGVTTWIYEQRKARGAKHKKQLEIAIAGLRAAVGLSMNRGNQELTSHLGMLADEFSRELGRCKEAFATKRHGRDRAHSILYQCQLFLESQLAQPVTFVTLANLVNAGYEADGNLPEEPVTEEQIRKSLANFKRNSPLWSNDPRFELRVIDPATN